MASITVEIDLSNAAFEDYGTAELVNILREVADKAECESEFEELNGLRLLDSNGNTCGSVSYDDDEF